MSTTDGVKQSNKSLINVLVFAPKAVSICLLYAGVHGKCDAAVVNEVSRHRHDEGTLRYAVGDEQKKVIYQVDTSIGRRGRGPP